MKYYIQNVNIQLLVFPAACSYRGLKICSWEMNQEGRIGFRRPGRSLHKVPQGSRRSQHKAEISQNRRYTEYFCMQCTLTFFLISGIKFFICIRVYFIYRTDLYFLSHVRFIFPNLKSYLFFMNTSCLTGFGCVPHTASF